MKSLGAHFVKFTLTANNGELHVRPGRVDAVISRSRRDGKTETLLLLSGSGDSRELFVTETVEQVKEALK